MEQKKMLPVTKPIIGQGLPEIWKNALPNTMKPNIPNLIKGLLVAPFGQPGNALEGLFNEAAKLMRMQGVAQENIKAALIIFSVLCSSKVGMPLSIVFRVDEDKAVAEHLLTACLKLVPQSLYIELHNQKIDDLYSAGDHYRNKVLICRDLKSLKKIESHLTHLIVDGEISIQTSVKTKFGSRMLEFQVNGPVAFIGIEAESDPRLFDHPWMMRIPVSDSDFNQEFDGSEKKDVPGVEFEMARIAEYVNRFSFRHVSFTQKDGFLSVIRKQHPSNYIHKLRFVFRLLDVLTIFNNPKPPNFENFLAKNLETNPEHVRSWMKENGWWENTTTNDNDWLKVGKVEHFMMAIILDEMLPVKYPVTSSLRKQIFEVAKDINFGKMKVSFASSNNILKQLYLLAKTDSFWAKLEDIYLKLNNHRTDIISEGNIEKEITAIRKIGAVERKKLKDNDGYGYYVTTNSMDKGVKFPTVTDLFGECEPGNLIEVVNPVTGKAELI